MGRKLQRRHSSSRDMVPGERVQSGMGTLTLLSLVLGGTVGRGGPPMMSATAEGLERCPAEAVATWRVQLEERMAAPARAAVQRSYDRAVAEWAVCAHARQLNSWNVPDVGDPA